MTVRIFPFGTMMEAGAETLPVMVKILHHIFQKTIVTVPIIPKIGMKLIPLRSIILFFIIARWEEIGTVPLSISFFYLCLIPPFFTINLIRKNSGKPIDQIVKRRRGTSISKKNLHSDQSKKITPIEYKVPYMNNSNGVSKYACREGVG